MSRAASLFVCLVIVGIIAAVAAAQDGASYDVRARTYRPPAASLAGAAETPERLAAIAPLLQGKPEEALPKLKQLAESGDVPSAIFVGDLYRAQSRLSVSPDPAVALHFYTLASQQGSGEASELIAEMVEHNQVAASQAQGDAGFWRAKARSQGWKQQRFSAYCFDWIHGPEPLHCAKLQSSPPEMKMPPEVQPQCPTAEEMATLRRQGMTGALRQNGGSLRLDAGPQARAILILDHAVPSEQDLREPDSASVIYIQTAQNRWKMLPADAPLLDRFMIFTPNAPDKMERMMLLSQAVDGSLSGGACSQFTR